MVDVANKQKPFTKRDLVRVHKLAEEIYVSSKANPEDCCFLHIEEAFDLAFEFHLHALEVWDNYEFLCEENMEEENG